MTKPTPKQLQEALDRATIALAFYATAHNWLSGSVPLDRGERARACLAKLNGDDGGEA